MASMIYLDTHVVAWLYASGREAVPASAANLVESVDEVRISPMVRLELQYLYEVGRVSRPSRTVLDALEATLGLTVCRAAFSAVVLEAETHDWTHDPFDRLIVAQAALRDAPLLTKDATIHAHYGKAAWDS